MRGGRHLVLGSDVHHDADRVEPLQQLPESTDARLVGEARREMLGGEDPVPVSRRGVELGLELLSESVELLDRVDADGAKESPSQPAEAARGGRRRTKAQAAPACTE